MAQEATMNTKTVVAIVDDDHSVREALESLLESARFETRVFSSAESLLASEDLNDLDCVVSDVAMPGMSGVALKSTLKHLLPSVPVILITGHMDLLSYPGSGFNENEILAKPIDGEELIHMIDIAYRSRRARDAG